MAKVLETTLLSWLLIAVRDFDRKKSELLNDRTMFDNFCIEHCKKAKFIPENNLKSAVLNLQLYLLGNEDNVFSKTLSK